MFSTPNLRGERCFIVALQKCVPEISTFVHVGMSNRAHTCADMGSEDPAACAKIIGNVYTYIG